MIGVLVCGVASGVARRLGGVVDWVCVIEKRREENDDGDDDFKFSVRVCCGFGFVCVFSF